MTKKNRKVIVYAAIAVIVLTGGLAGYVILWPQPPPSYPTYFTYTSDELDSLRKLSSDRRMSIDDLFEWEDMLFDLLSERKIEKGDVKRILPYLVVAQRDAAFLSSNVHQEFRGSIDPVSRDVACIFIRDVCQKIPVETDAYSELMAEIVLRKVEARIGKTKVTQMMWLIESPEKYRVPEPPEIGSEAFEIQLQMVIDALSNITDDQILAVFRWAGGQYTVGTNSLWLEEATKFMRQNDFSDLVQALMIRSVLMMTVLDTRAAVDDSKFTHMVQRPATRFDPDDPIYTIMDTPGDPGYPSTSMAVASASAAILSHCIPENTDEWNATADEIGKSRVWSGIHYPMDVDEGISLGRGVGSESLMSAGIEWCEAR